MCAESLSGADALFLELTPSQNRQLHFTLHSGQNPGVTLTTFSPSQYPVPQPTINSAFKYTGGPTTFPLCTSSMSLSCHHQQSPGLSTLPQPSSRPGPCARQPMSLRVTLGPLLTCHYFPRYLTPAPPHLIPSTPATEAAMLVLKYIRHAPASGPLHILFRL